MSDNRKEEIDYIQNKDNDVNANTNLAHLGISDNSITTDVNTAKVDTNNGDEPSMFPANNLLRKTADNLARSEAMIDDEPIRTEMTAELERREAEDSDNND